MSDFLISLGRNGLAKKAIKTLGLPIPLPQALRREAEPYQAKALLDMSVRLQANAGSELAPHLEKMLSDLGAVLTKESQAGYDALVYDASDLKAPKDLRGVYDFYHDNLSKLKKNARVLLLARPPESCEDEKQSASMRSLVGFVKSLGKEVGKRGATTQLLYVEEGAENRLMLPLAFFLSARSSFISGQTVRVKKQVLGNASPLNSKPLAGKTALVTGALRGIGRSIASQLALEGAEVICVDLAKDLAELEVYSRSIGGVALGINIMDQDAPVKISQLAEKSGGIDILVHNAGITRDRTLQNMSAEWWDQTIGINFEAVVNITGALIKKGLNQNARVVCLASIGGIGGVFGQTNYGASKAGIIGYVRALAPKLANKGITVNAVAPGFIETRMTNAMPMMVREVARRFNALSQAGMPEDVAQLVTFLSMPQSMGVTGQVIRVCGLNILGA